MSTASTVALAVPSAKPQTQTLLFDPDKARATIEAGARARWIQRQGRPGKGKGFRYLDAKGRPITDEATLDRIKALVLPPAWQHVRIAPSDRGNLQALGMDSTGRVQYRYHARHAARQKDRKFSRIEAFGTFLPVLREKTNADLASGTKENEFPRRKVLAVMVRLVNSLYMRVGTEQSVDHYKTYGITTLQNRHLETARKNQLVFSYVGKHHVQQRKVLVDPELYRIVLGLKGIGGVKKLFNYIADDGQVHPVRPADINSYLKEVTAPDYTAKDFRTWGATLLAAQELAETGVPAEPSEQLTKKNVVKVVKAVAERLGNTPAVCRESYIHPKVLRAYETGVTLDAFVPKKQRRAIRAVQTEQDHEIEEKALLKLFKS